MEDPATTMLVSQHSVHSFEDFYLNTPKKIKTLLAIDENEKEITKKVPKPVLVDIKVNKV